MYEGSTHDSTGDYYYYAYDAVGNRLEQVRSFGGQQSTETYQYDTANRLLSVNEVPYTWDNNGNLPVDQLRREPLPYFHAFP